MFDAGLACAGRMLESMNDKHETSDSSGAPYDDAAENYFRGRSGWRSARSENRTDLYFDQWTLTETDRFPWRSPTIVQCVGGGQFQLVWADVPFEPLPGSHIFANLADLMRAIESIEEWVSLDGDEPPHFAT
jgi:hypothetical protein